MGLKICKDCDKSISENASTCPNCGRHQIPKGVGDSLEKLVSYVVPSLVFSLFLMVLLIVAFLFFEWYLPEFGPWGIVPLILIGAWLIARAINALGIGRNRRGDKLE